MFLSVHEVCLNGFSAFRILTGTRRDWQGTAGDLIQGEEKLSEFAKLRERDRQVAQMRLAVSLGVVNVIYKVLCGWKGSETATFCVT